MTVTPQAHTKGGMSEANRAALLRFFDGTMRPGEVVRCLSSYQDLHPSRQVRRGAQVRPLPAFTGPLPDLRFEDGGRSFDLYDYLATNRVAGLLVMKGTEVIAECYELGMTEQTLWASCSMAKSVSSTLVGMAVQDGSIRSLDDPIARYVPRLARGAYAGVSIRQVLEMRSGVAWNETYTDPTSDRRRLLDVQFALRQGAIIDFMADLPRRAAPGEAWTYNTGESYLVGALLEAATGRNGADYLSDRLWAPLGMEQDAYWWTVGADGMVLAGSGISATLRDYARFGRFVLEGGVIGGQAQLPVGWFDQAQPSPVQGVNQANYGSMWWLPELPDPILAGSFQAEGIYGQTLHINPGQDLLIVALCARAKPSVRSRVEFNDDAFFAGVARSCSR